MAVTLPAETGQHLCDHYICEAKTTSLGPFLAVGQQNILPAFDLTCQNTFFNRARVVSTNRRGQRVAPCMCLPSCDGYDLLSIVVT